MICPQVNEDVFLGRHSNILMLIDNCQKKLGSFPDEYDMRVASVDEETRNCQASSSQSLYRPGDSTVYHPHSRRRPSKFVQRKDGGIFRTKEFKKNDTICEVFCCVV